MDEKYPYQRQWEEYRRRRNSQYIVFIVGALASNLIFYALTKIGVNTNIATLALAFLLAVWFIALIFAVFRFHKWKCPACGERFFVSSFWIRQPEFQSMCSNCSLLKFSGSTFERINK